MIILWVIFLLCTGAVIYGTFIESPLETIIGKVIAGFTIFPLLIGVAFIVAILSASLISLPTLLMERTMEYDAPIQIYSIKDNHGINGSFVLGSGSVKDELKYYYVIDTEKGKQIESYSAKDSYIIESDDVANVVIEKSVLKSKFWNTLLLDVKYMWGNNKAIITVPKGTIIEEYRIDLQ